VTDKPEIKLKSEIHHKSTVVSLLFGYDRELINRVKTIEGAAWSNSRRFWYIPAEKFRLSEVFNTLNPVAWLDYSALKSDRAKGCLKSLDLNRNVENQECPVPKGSLIFKAFPLGIEGQKALKNPNERLLRQPQNKAENEIIEKQQRVLSKETITKLDEFHRWLAHKRYSSSTIKTYLGALRSFLQYTAHKALAEIGNEDVVAYVNDVIIASHLSFACQSH